MRYDTAMAIHTTQKVIKIGTSAGLTLPAKELRQAGIAPGDSVDVVIRKHQNTTDDAEVQSTAKDILKRYHDDFKNLAQR